ncbi:MAG TPA: tryptophan 7-halogenase [Phycisphaerae bacterium]|nr:tryptophan 7-halogenase [Phycisphaerae bacterium]
MSPKRDHYDCIIIGGGPAGATAATVLADHGRSVLVLEKDTFPRHHIGESLMPHTHATFARIGMLEKLAASDFPRKESVQFVSASGRESDPFFFPDWRPEPSSTTWQVPRDRFDPLMLDNAREHGAEVHNGVRVGQVLFEGEQAVGVRAVFGGAERDIRAAVVVDASGLGAVIARQLRLTEHDPRLRNGAIYGYFRGAYRDAGRNAGATIILYTPTRDGWFWFIPLPDDLTSVGIVATPEYLFRGRGDQPQRTLADEIAGCPAAQRRLDGAEQVGGVYVTRDFSYRARRIAGPGWLLCGDAFGFLDPVYSSGLMLALKMGELGADAIHDALAAGDVSAKRLGRHEEMIVAGMTSIRRLVYAFYDRNFSFGRFLADHPQQKDNLTRILVGDVFNAEVPRIFEFMKDYADIGSLETPAAPARTS